MSSSSWWLRASIYVFKAVASLDGQKHHILWWFRKWFAKICNNLDLAVSMLGVSESFVLGQSLGISANTLTKIFNSSSARCWSSDT